jgi:hypothetical protein
MKKTPATIATVIFLLISPHLNAEDNKIQSTTKNDKVARAMFTTAIKDHEPVDEIGQLDNTIEKIFFFTEIIGMTGQTVTHQWQHKGSIKAKTKLKIGGKRWRAWSSKKLLPQWVGVWTVTVLDNNGNILAEQDMAYIPTDTKE